MNEIVQAEPERALVYQDVSLLTSNAELARAGSMPVVHQGEKAHGFENLLVATDFSFNAHQAVQAASNLAERFCAHLTVLHVVNTTPEEIVHHAGTARTLMIQLWHQSAQQLNRLIENLAREGLEADAIIAEGLPCEQIVLQSANFDLLLLGRPTQRRRRSFFSVNTARRVLQEAACPVMVV